nr:hypothetical protein [uncultured Acetatifactor sp.]
MDMGNTLFQAICRMGIFMICAQAVVHFRPKESYEKYLKLLVSVIVLIQVFLPIGSFLLGDGRQNAARALEQFGRELEQGLEDAAGEAAAADELLEQMTLEEVMRRLEEQEGAQGGSQGQEDIREDGPGRSFPVEDGLPEGVQGGRQNQQDAQKDSQGSGFPEEEGLPEGGAQGGNPGQQEGQADEGGAGWRVEIDSEAIEPVSVEPIGPVQGGTEEAQGH